jgi:Arc/MetJ-type ribon-helix-helix transcriptional regulator
MKKPISATIDDELIRWIDKEITSKRRYRNRSHLIEIALDNLRKEDKKEEKKEDKR